MLAEWIRCQIEAGLGLDDPVGVVVDGAGALPSAYPVTDLVVGAMAAAGAASAELIHRLGGGLPTVHVDRRLASLWSAWSLVPDGWTVPGAWDPIAGDYRCADGRWVKLHTNAPRHRAAALGVLGLVPAGSAVPDRDAVAGSVGEWQAEALEAAVVAAGGCAAVMRTEAEWDEHPQGSSVAAEAVIAVERGATGAPSASTGSAASPGRPLAGVRVLDLTRVLAGPVATRFLAGLGADVLRVDPPVWDEPGVVPEVTLGKRCVRLDARAATGHEQLRDLLAGADVLVHGYRPGALDGLGLDAVTRAALRPGLVEVTLDAYGWTGPWAGRRGFDSLVQMSSGIAARGQDLTAAPRPVPLPVQALDHAAGYVLAAAALRGWMAALDGTGSRSRTSLARVARLLVDASRHEPGVASFAASVEPIGHEDVAVTVEETTWGPARRLRPPLRIGDGPLLRWDRPAVALGSSGSEAHW